VTHSLVKYVPTHWLSMFPTSYMLLFVVITPLFLKRFGMLG
jgi:hypothetical protein